MSEVLRERAGWYLLDRLHDARASARPAAEPGVPPRLGLHGYEPDQYRRGREHASACVEALRAVGVLGDADARMWAARFDAVLDDGTQQVTASPDLIVQLSAREFLAARLEDVDAVVGGSEEPAAVLAFERVLRAVTISEALDGDECGEWLQRLRDTVSDEGRDWLARRFRRPWAWKGTELQRVVAGPRVRHGGVAIRYVELHEDALVIHWHHVAALELDEADKDDPVRRHRAQRAAMAPVGGLQFTVADDVGTRYLQTHAAGPVFDSSSDRDFDIVWGSELVKPGVPDDAGELLIEYGGELYELALG